MGILSTLFIAVGLIGFATGQQIEPRPSQNAERLERRVAELERQIAALLDELHELRRDVGPMRRLSIIPVKNIDPVECATLMKELWRRRPDVVIHAIPKMKAIAVQADQKTTSESRRLVAVLDIAPETTVPEIKVIIGRSDPRVFDQALRAIKKAQEDYEKTELAKRQGRWTLILARRGATRSIRGGQEMENDRQGR